MGYDGYPVPFYSGTSTPAGTSQVNILGDAPGYLNGLSGGSYSGATGNVSIADAQFATFGATELVAAAITVTDSAGFNHSLSTRNDPALADIVNDLDNPSLFGVFTLTAYPFNNAPARFASATDALADGNTGQPFDILLAITDNIPGFGFSAQDWAFDFSKEVGNLDGITSLQVTDVGAVPGVVPEPATVSLMAAGTLFVLRRRRTPLLDC